MKAVCLISGGIDSPVAGYLMIKKGVDVIFLHGGKGEKNEKVEKLVKIISPKGKLYYVNHRSALKTISENCDNKYTCLICKRFLYRCADYVCKKEGCDFIITGESIGQVASQTLQNLTVLDKAVEIPIIRPLIGLNKNDIISVAKEIGTFDISTTISTGVCPFVPNQPSTKADIKKVLAEEEKIKLDIEKLFYK
ncbi:tRNA sulfurtransferase [Candidatus Tiddalikarchaeum anstoanum]|nr:tRNA sulfurtransferase [Candidatus Tiddalikarchaeum anstoanum]